jgi:2-iminobutanoate/2-iminopropanoate deaminase
MNPLNPDGVWRVPDQFRTIYSHAFEIGAARRTLLISGQFGVRPDGSLAKDFAGQAEQAMANVETLLGAAGMSLKNLAKVTYLLTGAENFAALGDIRRRRWASSEPPAVTAIVVLALARPDYLIEIEAIAAET